MDSLTEGPPGALKPCLILLDGATSHVGQTITYTITVFNNGPADATSVVVIDVLPAGGAGICGIGPNNLVRACDIGADTRCYTARTCRLHEEVEMQRSPHNLRNPHISRSARIGVLTAVLVVSLAALAYGHPEHRSHKAPSVKAEIRGTLDSMNGDRWVVAGRELIVSPYTDVEKTIIKGSYVKVKARQDADGNWVADEIDRKRKPWSAGSKMEIKLKGSIESMVGNTWTVAGMEFEVTPYTSIEDSVSVGDRVKVEATPDESGKLVAEEVDSKEKRHDHD